MQWIISKDELSKLKWKSWQLMTVFLMV